MQRHFWQRVGVSGILIAASTFTQAQTALGHQPSVPTQTSQAETWPQQSGDSLDQQAESELETGSALTGQGQFTEAIPHLVASRGRVKNEYAAAFNLAICYIATGQPRQAIPILKELRGRGRDSADVNNLLAQAYVGDSQESNALEALERAASVRPGDEKLFLFVADACMGKQSYALGMRVVDLGLKTLPNSAGLHFERGMFLAVMDRFDQAKCDFERARELAPDSEIAYIAGAQESMYAGNIAEAVRVSREGLSRGHRNFLLLTLFGEASLRAGIVPGQKEFEEARKALETAVAEKPSYPSAELALGKIYLLAGQTGEAIARFEMARELSPGNASVYSNLAAAYRKQGDIGKAREALAKLEELNQAQADKIRTAPGETKAGYGGALSQQH